MIQHDLEIDVYGEKENIFSGMFNLKNMCKLQTKNETKRHIKIHTDKHINDQSVISFYLKS